LKKKLNGRESEGKTCNYADLGRISVFCKVV
jgi:hypothetical protein